MLKIYCSECGSGVEYLSNKPKFCTNCGNSFNKNILNKKIEAKKQPSLEIEENENLHHDDDDASSNSVPDINNLEYDISMPQKRKETIGNLVGTHTPGSDLNLPEIERKQVSREEFLENFAKEAGSLRGKTRKKNGSKN